MQKNSLFCFSCQQQWQNLQLTNVWVKNFFTNVHYCDANVCCRNDAAHWWRLLHDIPVVHVTAALNMAKIKIKLKILDKK